MCTPLKPNRLKPNRIHFKSFPRVLAEQVAHTSSVPTFPSNRVELRGDQVDDTPLVPSGVDNGNWRKNIDQLFEPRKKNPNVF